MATGWFASLTVFAATDTAISMTIDIDGAEKEALHS